jgi:hypothetical protein
VNVGDAKFHSHQMDQLEAGVNNVSKTGVLLSSGCKWAPVDNVLGLREADFGRSSVDFRRRPPQSASLT